MSVCIYVHIYTHIHIISMYIYIHIYVFHRCVSSGSNRMTFCWQNYVFSVFKNFQFLSLRRECFQSENFQSIRSCFAFCCWIFYIRTYVCIYYIYECPHGSVQYIYSRNTLKLLTLQESLLSFRTPIFLSHDDNRKMQSAVLSLFDRLNCVESRINR